MTKPVIFGCEGATLSESEQQFFRDADPLGFILFARNCETQAQIKRLKAQQVKEEWMRPLDESEAVAHIPPRLTYAQIVRLLMALNLPALGSSRSSCCDAVSPARSPFIQTTVSRRDSKNLSGSRRNAGKGFGMRVEAGRGLNYCERSVSLARSFATVLAALRGTYL